METFNTAAATAALGALATASGYAASIRAAGAAADSVVEQFSRQFQANNVPVTISRDPNLASNLAEMMRSYVAESLALAHDCLEKAPLPGRLKERLKEIKESVDGEGDLNPSTVRVRIDDLANDIIYELREPLFLHVSADRRSFYEQKEPVFGSSVESKFPDSIRDVAAAARCFALDEWTASVFHLMRALESPLHVLAGRIGVVLPAPLDLENWKNIIDTIESRVNAEVKRLEQTTKGHSRNHELKLLGEAALQFRHFKNAWRNDAAHGREHYDEREATMVFNAVKTFMQHLASVI